jgi:hypothetical protein
MKTVKVIFLAVFLLSSGMIKTMAVENESYDRAVYQMQEQLKTALNQFPMEAIDTYDNSLQMVLTFKVNANHRMENIRVECKDESLAYYVQSLLERKKIELNSALDGKYCKVPLRFIDARL